MTWHLDPLHEANRHGGISCSRQNKNCDLTPSLVHIRIRGWSHFRAPLAHKPGLSHSPRAQCCWEGLLSTPCCPQRTVLRISSGLRRTVLDRVTSRRVHSSTQTSHPGPPRPPGLIASHSVSNHTLGSSSRVIIWLELRVQDARFPGLSITRSRH